MVLRAGFAALAAIFLIAADDPPQVSAEEPANTVSADYEWLRGAFDDASERERTAFAEWQARFRECYDTAMAEMRAEIAAAGFPDAPLEGVGPAGHLCRQDGSLPRPPSFASYADFQAELAVAGPIIDAFLFAVRRAEAMNAPGPDDGLRLLLERRVLGEQVLRSALSWGQGMAEDAPPLSPTGRAIALTRIADAVGRRDYENTEWLKQIVAEHGWPTISMVGPTASGNAWLLVQHADHDPHFQLQMLRLMEPLADEGEINPQNYAYLYDRVMLKLTGTQRYGTQAMCDEGELVPRALEDDATVDMLRAEVGLEPLDEYLMGMREMFGPCGAPAS